MYQAELKIRYSKKLMAESVRNALSPDDKASTGTMRVSSRVTGKTLTVQVHGVDRFESLQATIHDIFRCIHAAEASLQKLGVSS
ncbi:MAG TPA: KEOPS complex subunit Pcc1 [Candidatus Acidoferrales bacterium]|nr:KEOPS complex subunit Pcc1 [Candidatus Acidoferrales bacterium]